RSGASRVDDEQACAVVDALEQVVEEDRVRLAGVRTPQDDHVRFLDLFIGRRAAARTEYRRQTDDARCVSSSVTRIDVVGAHHLARELLRQVVHLVGRLRAREDPERTRRISGTRSIQAGGGAIERLLPRCGTQLAIAPDEGRGQSRTGSHTSSLERVYFRARNIQALVHRILPADASIDLTALFE